MGSSLLPLSCSDPSAFARVSLNNCGYRCLRPRPKRCTCKLLREGLSLAVLANLRSKRATVLARLTLPFHACEDGISAFPLHLTPSSCVWY